jgi:hypothetical protein
VRFPPTCAKPPAHRSTFVILSPAFFVNFHQFRLIFTSKKPFSKKVINNRKFCPQTLCLSAFAPLLALFLSTPLFIGFIADLAGLFGVVFCVFGLSFF